MSAARRLRPPPRLSPISPHISPYLAPRSRRRALVFQPALERTRTPLYPTASRCIPPYSYSSHSRPSLKTLHDTVFLDAGVCRTPLGSPRRRRRSRPSCRGCERSRPRPNGRSSPRAAAPAPSPAPSLARSSGSAGWVRCRRATQAARRAPSLSCSSCRRSSTASSLATRSVDPETVGRRRGRSSRERLREIDSA